MMQVIRSLVAQFIKRFTTDYLFADFKMPWQKTALVYELKTGTACNFKCARINKISERIDTFMTN